MISYDVPGFPITFVLFLLFCQGCTFCWVVSWALLQDPSAEQGLQRSPFAGPFQANDFFEALSQDQPSGQPFLKTFLVRPQLLEVGCGAFLLFLLFLCATSQPSSACAFGAGLAFALRAFSQSLVVLAACPAGWSPNKFQTKHEWAASTKKNLSQFISNKFTV